MENLVKGWLTSLIGFAGILVLGGELLGFFSLPNPLGLSVYLKYGIGVPVCFGLFLMPKDKITEMVETIVSSIFKKKSE
jgi:hypothetical protein